MSHIKYTILKKKEKGLIFLTSSVIPYMRHKDYT